MKIKYLDERCVDCTCDPHPVNYGSLHEALDDVRLVCESDLVSAILNVYLYEKGFKEAKTSEEEEDKKWESDDYYVSDLYDKHRQALTDDARKHKVYGMWWCHDPETKKTLPIGLSGVLKALELIRAEPERFENLSIPVVWSYFNDHKSQEVHSS